jgi:hypothetical protein
MPHDDGRIGVDEGNQAARLSRSSFFKLCFATVASSLLVAAGCGGDDDDDDEEEDDD